VGLSGKGDIARSPIIGRKNTIIMFLCALSCSCSLLGSVASSSVTYRNTMKIVQAGKEDAELLATLVSKANEDVAKLLNLNRDNAAKHPSFCTAEWILADFARGQEFFLVYEDDVAKGCVAFEQPDRNTAYLNRLAVLPEFRRRGLGGMLVQHIIDYASSKDVNVISIGIIAEHRELKEWYLKIGFVAGRIQQFEHLPFTVLYMTYAL